MTINHYISKPYIVIEQINMKDSGEISFYGWDKETWKVEISKDRNRVAIFKIKLK